MFSSLDVLVRYLENVNHILSNGSEINGELPVESVKKYQQNKQKTQLEICDFRTTLGCEQKNNFTLKNAVLAENGITEPKTL